LKRPIPRIKWHMLRRHRSDPPFLRENLRAALRARAPCEVDLVFTADGHAFCLHDLCLDRETTGFGPASARTRREIERLRQRGNDGSVLDSAPLFLDEIVAEVRGAAGLAPASVQLDVKAPVASFTEEALRLFRVTLAETAPLFIASGEDWLLIERLSDAAPRLHGGFDPLCHYPRSYTLDSHQFRGLGEKMLAMARGATMFYLEADLVIAGLNRGVNLVDIVSAKGALVDVWTLDADRPGLQGDLRRMIEAGCDQITSNDPETLRPLVEEIVA
jgi:glycerophosphoryl diester phosphodiesterase